MSYRTILRRRHELGRAFGEWFSRISDELVSNILRRTLDAKEVMIIGERGSLKRDANSEI